MTSTTRLLAPATLLTLAASLAPAAISSVGGSTTFLATPPTSVNIGTHLSPNAFCWNEQTNVTTSLLIDMVNNPGSSLTPVPGTISTSFDSHFLHFDGISGITNGQGSITFTQPIIGVMFSATSLDNTDVSLGSLTTIYPTSYPFRGLNTVVPSWVTISGNTLTFDLTTLAPIIELAQARIFTAVPTPGSLALLAVGGTLIARRRR